MACWETLLVDGVDIATWAGITDAEGLLSISEADGDLIEYDHVDGGTWQAGPTKPYTFDVQVVMNSNTIGDQVSELEALRTACKVGTVVTLTRRLTVGAAQVSDTCTAVITNVVVNWQFKKVNELRALLVIQSLSGKWTRV